MDGKSIVEACKKHNLFSWSASGKVQPVCITKAEGPYIWTAEGEKLLDLVSQMISVNIGHSHPKVLQAIRDAADELIYAAPSCATEAKARFGQKLAGLFPGDLNRFFMCLGGSDANENAIKMVRQFTGREKVMGRYRSYHGATYATMALGGDPRSHNVPPLPGFVHVLSIAPAGSSQKSDEDVVSDYLEYLESVICLEGADTIAALFVEVVPGTNGVLVPPAGYLSRVQDLLRKYDILLVCDEVMSGFGRTGKMFAFEHHNIQPDLVTAAKGLSSSYVPLGCVALTDRIAAYFDENTFWGGLTYNAHSLALNIASAALDVLVEENMVENSRVLGLKLAERFRELEKHPAVTQARNQGLFGAIEISERLLPSQIKTPQTKGNALTGEIKQRLRAEGLYVAVRYNCLLFCPPLCVTEEQMHDALQVIDRELGRLDGLL